MRVKKFKVFTESTNVDKAYKAINESIFDFVSKDTVSNVDVEELNKVQNDVLSKYDLPKSDIENIRSRISDAISKRIGGSDISNNIKMK